MLEEINKSIILVALFWFSSCSNAQERESVVLSFDKKFISYSTFIDSGTIVREKLSWDNDNDCISSSETENFKLVKDVLFIKQVIQHQDLWYPYLLLSSNEGLSYSKLLPYTSYTITNNLVYKTDSTYKFHQIRREVNGHIEREVLITLNENWLPIEEIELKVPFGEQEKEYRLTTYPEEIPQKMCYKNLD